MKRRKTFVALLICLIAALFACGIFTLFNKHEGEEVITAEAAGEMPVTETIYWGFNATTGELKLSSEVVGGDNSGEFSGATELSYNTIPWKEAGVNELVTSVVVADPIAISSGYYFFAYLPNAKSFDVSKLNTSNVTRMDWMFYRATAPTLDLTSFDVSNVKSARSVFQSSYIKTIDISTWVCSSMDDISQMFSFNGLSAGRKISIPDSLLNVPYFTDSYFYGGFGGTAYGEDGTAYTSSNLITKGGTYTSYPPHEHDYKITSTLIEATCTEEGEAEYTCSVCTDTKTEKVSALGHSMTVTAAKEATCTTAGNSAYWYCDRCKKYFSDANGATEIAEDSWILPVAEHSFSTDWLSNATNHWQTCKYLCGTTSSPEAHDFVWKTDKAPTFTETGIQHEECTVCGFKRNEGTEMPVIICEHTNKTPHARVEATCKKEGNVEYWHCEDCNKNVDSNGVEIEDITIAINSEAHSFTTYVSDGNATCIADGTKTATCGHGCGTKDTIADEGTALGHDWGEWHTTKEPTETEEGENQRECSRCNETQTEPVAMLSHTHTFATEWSGDDENHWHAATCAHTSETKDKAPHDWDNGQITSQPTATAKGVKTFTCNTCGQTRTEEFAADTNAITAFNFGGWIYGDTPATHTATATFGTPTITYSNAIDGTYAATKPTNAGTYWVKAEVTADPNGIYPAAVEKKSFTIAKRAITVTINAASSEEGQELEALTATVTSGTLAAGDSNVYELTTTADKDSINSYPITGTCLNDNYNITFVDGVYIVSKRAEDPNGGGTIDLPTDANVEFKVTQSKTTGDYSQLDGMKVGYWAQLWNRNADGTLGDEYTDSLNCVLTLKIPTEIIEAIRGGEEINREKIADGLGVYYVTDGGLEKVNAFTIAQREDESWIIKFNYNSKFRAEVVFNAENYEEPTEEPAKAGIPWWVWLIVGIGGATLITIIIVAVVLAKKKSANSNNAPAPAPTPAPAQGEKYDDAELKARLDEQSKRIDELANRDDGGFNDVYRGE